MMQDLLTWGLRMGVLTSVLIGLVLLVRRPFRHFGAEATFLLWSLPILRLAMPDFRLLVQHDIAPFQALSFEEIELFMRNSFEAAPNSTPDGMNRMLENCPNANYNYMRRRAGLPEIT